MDRRKLQIFLMALISAFLLGYIALSSAQQLPPTPLSGVWLEEKNYPHGSRLRAQYETFKGGIEMLGVRAGMTEAAIGFAVAAELQSRLPEGFALQKGYTTRMIGDLPQAAAAEEARPSNVKFITLYPVEYKGVSLSKGSDYLAIISEDGRLLATRKRALPVTVDAITSTAALEKAVEVAKQLGRRPA